MVRIKMGLMVLSVIFWAGCVYSLNPFYEDRDVLFNPELLGEWTSPRSEEETLRFEAGQDKSYLVYMRFEGQEKVLVAHLFQLHGVVFLDFFPKSSGEDEDFFFARMVPAHGLAKLEIAKSSIKLRVLDPQWLENLKKSGGIDLTFWENGLALVTDSTEKIKEFIEQKVLTDPGAFSELMEYKKVEESFRE